MYKRQVLISLATTSLIGCSDWTESEAKTFPESIVSDEYYAACVPISRQITKLPLAGLVAVSYTHLYLNYQSALKSLEDFGGSTIPLENITIDWLKRCLLYTSRCV